MAQLVHHKLAIISCDTHVLQPDFDETAPFILLNMGVGCPLLTHQD